MSFHWWNANRNLPGQLRHHFVLLSAAEGSLADQVQVCICSTWALDVFVSSKMLLIRKYHNTVSTLENLKLRSKQQEGNDKIVGISL